MDSSYPNYFTEVVAPNITTPKAMTCTHEFCGNTNITISDTDTGILENISCGFWISVKR